MVYLLKPASSLWRFIFGGLSEQFCNELKFFQSDKPKRVEGNGSSKQTNKPEQHIRARLKPRLLKLGKSLSFFVSLYKYKPMFKGKIIFLQLPNDFLF